MNQSLQEAVKVIKTAILKAQSEVLRNANTSLLSLYYGIGRYVSQKSAKAHGELGQSMRLVGNYRAKCRDCMVSGPET